MERERRGDRVGTTTAAIETGRPGHLGRNFDFLRLWMGQVASALGNGISLVATPLLVLALTDSPALAGLVAAARTAPYLVLGLPAGALIDRLDRRTILILCDVARFLAMGSVPIAWVAGTLEPTQLIVVALVQGVAVTFANLAQVAALPRLVRRDQIPSAQALNVSSQGVASLVGPGLGGLVVGFGATLAEGAVIAFGVDSLTYIVSAAMLLSIRKPFQIDRTGATVGMGQQIVEGLRFLWTDRPIRLLAIVNMIHRFCIGSVVVLAVVVFARDVLAVGPSVIGLIVGAAGAGGLLGSILAPVVRRTVSVGWSMVATILLHGVGIALVALSRDVALAMAGMAVVGIAEAMTSVIQVSYRLATIPDALQGRVNSVYRMGSFGAMTGGTALAGFLVETQGAGAALWMMAAYILTIGVGVGLSGVRRL